MKPSGIRGNVPTIGEPGFHSLPLFDALNKLWAPNSPQQEADGKSQAKFRENTLAPSRQGQPQVQGTRGMKHDTVARPRATQRLPLGERPCPAVTEGERSVSGADALRSGDSVLHQQDYLNSETPLH